MSLCLYTPVMYVSGELAMGSSYQLLRLVMKDAAVPHLSSCF